MRILDIYARSYVRNNILQWNEIDRLKDEKLVVIILQYVETVLHYVIENILYFLLDVYCSAYSFRL